MRSMHYPKQKSPGKELVKVITCCFLLSILTIVGVLYTGEAIDKFFDNIKHQLYTTIAVTLILFVSWIFWRVRK